MYIQPDSISSNPLNIYKQQSERIQQETEQEQKRVAPERERTGDTVTLSSESRMMMEANRVAHNTPDIRQDRVAELKAQVDDGTYHIDNRRTAEAMLRDDMQMFTLP